MKIVDLIVYPIKSMGGISLTHARLEARGIAFDRRWMLVDDKGAFISQRIHPELALFQPSLNDNELNIINQNSGNLISIPYETSGEKIEVEVWHEKMQAIEVSTETSEWFTTELGTPVRLVFMPETTIRKVDEQYAKHGEVVGFADGYPLLIVNTASLLDLNNRLEDSVTINRFRPNIVVDGTNPYEEDDWNEIVINDVKISLVKKCARCIMVDIDPITAHKNGNVLKTLSDYRKLNNKVFFGINGLIKSTGIISVGDIVQPG